MTKEKVLEVLNFYEETLKGMRVECRSLSDNDRRPSEENTLSHCLDMIPQMREFIVNGRMEKTFGWLGFMQGCFLVNGIFL